ncbi:MAG TPA: isoquinoline 1-oxidoreductase [Cytophagales bacterium]|nr:isoquinoline 1-oxidoreductase [Cytophagales bacterium]
MSIIKTTYNRRSFLKASIAGGGGLMLSFSWLAACSPLDSTKELPSAWFDLNAYLSIADNGDVTIMSPNPEVGQNVKTSMPMIIAEELDVNWADVTVKQAPLNSVSFTRQVAGGSQSIRQGWQSLRMAGATAREMLKSAAAQKWNVNASDCTTENGYVIHGSNKLGYGEVATLAASMEVPAEVKLKDPSTYKIIGTDKGNVDIEGIITGKPLFGVDVKKENMQYAVVLRPPAFGLKLKSFDDKEARAINGVNDVIQFGSKIAVLANNTWAAMKGQRALKAEWEKDTMLESTSYHDKTMKELLNKKATEPKRSDGNARAQFAKADKVIEKTYEAPFLPHNAMEPMNFYANVTPEKAEFIGPIQTPERTRSQIAELLGRPEAEVTIDMTRMGGGFGRRLYGDFALEAAEISDKAKSPVQVIFSREDDMTAGTYRPASKYKFKAAIKEGKMVAYHLVGTGVNMGNATRENNFPACTLEHYLVESHELKSNITTGAWRAPITNFLAFAEQSFFDEVASELGQDPVQFRLDLFARAKENPIGELQYDVDKSIGVIKLAAEKSGWGKAAQGVYQGFSTYYSHNTYVAEVAEVVMQGNTPVIKRIVCAIDCGIVINPIAAINQVQGGVIDGIGHAMYGEFAFENGQPQFRNFDKYRMIRMKEAPEVEVHFVKSNNDPTGLGEPALPPAGGAVANAIAKATGKRFYKQPFIREQIVLG